MLLPDVPPGIPPDADLRLPLGEPFTIAQAEARGVSARVIHGMAHSGVLRRVVAGVYVDSAAADDVRLRCRAVSLVLPESAVVTDRTAAWLHGVEVLAPGDHVVPPPLDVFQLPGNTRVRKGACAGGERTLLPEDIEILNGIRVTTRLRTALDLGRLLRRDHAIGALDGLLRRGGFTHEELLGSVERFRRQRGVVQLRVLAPLADPRAESPGESVLRLRWIDAGLPPCRPQVEVRDGWGIARFRVDLGIEEERFGAEYDGWDFHSSEEDQARDRRRRSRLRREHGWSIVVLTKAEVFGPSPSAGRLLWAAYDAHPRPR